jgi:hypothetical protein
MNERAPNVGGDAAPALVTADPTFVVVHGVGRQFELDTLRTLIEGSHLGFSSPTKYSRAELDDIRTPSTPVILVEHGRSFAEVRYSPLAEAHSHYTEGDLRRWLRTLNSRLRRIHQSRVATEPPDFSRIEYVVDDIILTTTIAKFMAERLKIKTLSFEISAQAFLQQIQLFVDRTSYRESILASVDSQLAKVSEAEPSRPLCLVTHSLGTVVTFIALLRAQCVGAAWVAQVKWFFTFGSPVDLLFVLFPEFFAPRPPLSNRDIKWTNYTLANDPIASDLRVTSESLPTLAPGLFERDTIKEIALGPGSIATAHTDYWHDMRLLNDIFACHVLHDGKSDRDDPPVRPTGDKNESEQKERPQNGKVLRPAYIHITGFTLLGWIAVFVSSWISLIWWEENVKVHDNDRVVILNSGHYQLAIWALAAGLVFSYAVCWSCSIVARVICAVGCAIFSIPLYVMLPPLSFLGQPTGNPSSRGLDGLITGNVILFIVPMAAALGATLNGRRLPKSLVFGFLGLMMVFLSLFMGTRSNPSNVTEEFWTLALVFGFWLLAILIFRIDCVYCDYVRGRKHIDALDLLWNNSNETSAESTPVSEGKLGAEGQGDLGAGQ